jgi:hypothetical protein
MNRGTNAAGETPAAATEKVALPKKSLRTGAPPLVVFSLVKRGQVCYIKAEEIK